MENLESHMIVYATNLKVLLILQAFVLAFIPIGVSYWT